MDKFVLQAVILATASIERGFGTATLGQLGWKVDPKTIIYGYLTDGRYFVGEDVIRAVLPGE